MKKEQKEYLGKLAIEFVSIVTAVLLALLANRWYDAFKDQKRLRLALQSIRHEIGANIEMLEASLPGYQQYLDNLPNEVEKGQPLIFELYRMEEKDISSQIRIVHLLTAWESTRSSGVLEHMHPILVQKLTGIEKSVNRVEKREDRLEELLFSQESFSVESAGPMFQLFRTGLSHIVFEHNNLVEEYQEALKYMNETYGGG